MKLYNITNLLLILAPFLTVIAPLKGVSAKTCRKIAVITTLMSMIGFAGCHFLTSENSPIEFQKFLIIEKTAAACGILYNFVYFLIYIGFGKRIFQNKESSYWLLIQSLSSLALIINHTYLLLLILGIALILHIIICEKDAYQVSKKNDNFIIVKLFSVISILLFCAFSYLLDIEHHITLISMLKLNVEQLSKSTVYLGIFLIMSMIGIMPIHSWVKPLINAPTRYGLGAITRLNIGFVVWCKFSFLLSSSIAQSSTFLMCILGTNIIYAAFLLFGEKKLSQIISSLYIYHTSLLLLFGVIAVTDERTEILMDFANITIGISGLLIIINMLRDRIGAENIDHSSGLGISYPVFGISFLFCILSLIGFPGTLGFLTSEILLHNLSSSNLLIASIFIFSLILNGYSCFRIFGESFYGNPEHSFKSIFQPVLREKITLILIVVFLLLNGIGVQPLLGFISNLPEIIPTAHAEDSEQLWTTLSSTGTFGDSKYRWYLESQGRFESKADDIERLLLRGAVGYKIYPNFTLWSGYGWTPLFLNSKYQDEFINENRLWQQATYDHGYNDFKFNQRLRLEERFLEGVDSTALRLRYMSKVSHPIFNLVNNYTIGLTGYDELFLNLNSADKGPQSGFDRNRIFVGPYLSKGIFRTELGYLNELSRRPGKEDRRIQGVGLYIILNF